jgi:hypothetical protein
MRDTEKSGTVKQHVQAMVDEEVGLGDLDKMDRNTIEVLRRHIAVLESRQDGVEEILAAVGDALEELWWVSGTDAKLKIRVVEVLVKKIREA